jgi:hypothetical protein
MIRKSCQKDAETKRFYIDLVSLESYGVGELSVGLGPFGRKYGDLINVFRFCSTLWNSSSSATSSVVLFDAKLSFLEFLGF